MTTSLPPLPAGFRIEFDRDTAVLSGGRVLVGGEPPRVIRLTAAGARAFAELRSGPVRTAAAGVLARRLVSAGAAHPRPPAPAEQGRVAVVVPVRDRIRELDRCLGALDRAGVIVVDDGSDAPAAVAAVAARHRARLVVRTVNGGPAAARNSGLAACDSTGADLVAFVDSDCVPPKGWLDPLLAHFADPAVGAVAPRVVPLPASRAGQVDRSVLAAYAARSPLDLGRRESLVRPGTRVPFVPTAALVVRREALADPAFDEELRYGEDVDAIWRMVDAGWQVRYQSAVEVAHEEPSGWPTYLRRRFCYGTSAGQLALRYPARLAPAVLRPWPTAAAALLLAGHPGIAAAVTGVAAARLGRTLRASGAPEFLAPRMAAQSVTASMVGLARATTQLALPAAVAAAAAPPGRRGRRLAVLGAFLVAPAVHEWVSRRPDLDPARWILASLADDIAYGAGVWTGAVRAGTLAPLLPRGKPAG